MMGKVHRKMENVANPMQKNRLRESDEGKSASENGKCSESDAKNQVERVR